MRGIRRRPPIAMAAALLAGMLLSAIAAAQSLPPLLPDPDEVRTWRDSVDVAGQRRPVPELWRGLRLGAPDAPPPTDLVRLPASLCAQGKKVFLRLPAFLSFRAMAAEAASDGIELRAESGYRAPVVQAELIARRLARGREYAEIVRGVAPPGYSEHMLGTTLDLALGGDYNRNPAYHWLEAHAASHGWQESYPRNAAGGFPWEPWHWRWLGESASETQEETREETP